MGKAEFYDRFLFILITTITAFLVSGIASTETNDEIKAEGGKDLYDTDKYNSMKIHYANYPDDGSDLLWKNMESYGNATKLSDDQFVDGKAFINLPSKYQLFGLNFNNVAVTKEGTIQSADRSVKWTIAPLKAKFGMTRCNISYFFQGYDLYVQWNNFRFSHKNFEKYDFSFQVRLGDKGEIDFVYKEVPFNLTAWREYCKCLGDNFGVMYRHEELFQVPPYIEFYELGFLMSLKKYEVKKGTVVRLSPADECMFRKSCDACTETKFHINPNETARCSWCPAIEKCSSRRDGFRDMWKKKKCDNYRVNVPNFCSFLSTESDELHKFMIILFFVIVIIVYAISCCLVMKLAKLCCTSPFEWLRERIQSTNQPNQLDANNPSAEGQNNYHEEDVDNNSVQIQDTRV